MIYDLVVGLISIFILLLFFRGDLNQRSDRKKEVSNIAVEFFRDFTKPTSENHSKWGMKDFRIIGYNSLIRKSVAGKISIKETNASLKNFKIRIPCCCKGTDLKGRKVEFIRIIDAEIHDTSIIQYSFSDERPIKIMDRISFWVKTTFIFPIIMFLVLVLAWWLIGNENCFYAAFLGTRFVGSLNSVYTSYICWDSFLITLLCIAIYFSLYFLLLYLLKTLSE